MKVLHAASTPGEEGKQKENMKREKKNREKEIKREKESGKRN